MVQRNPWSTRNGSRRLLAGEVDEMFGDNKKGRIRYVDWLIRAGGKRMRRAIIKARHRYQAAKPAQIRASALHRAYRHKTRR